MKPLSLLSACPMACMALLALGASTLAAAPKPTVLIDFTDSHKDLGGAVFRAYEYTYNDWGDRHVMDLPGKGALIQAPSGKGGLGENKTLVKFDRTSGLDFIYLIGNANQAASINFAITDDDGTEYQWTIPLTGKPAGRPLVQHFDLTKPDSQPNAGKVSGMNFKRVSSWQVRGDFQAPKVEVLLIKLGAMIGE